MRNALLTPREPAADPTHLDVIAAGKAGRLIPIAASPNLCALAKAKETNVS